MLSLFSCTSWPFVHLWRNVYADPLPVFKLGYLCFNYGVRIVVLYIPDPSPLSDVLFAAIFSDKEILPITFLLYIFLSSRTFCALVEEFALFQALVFPPGNTVLPVESLSTCSLSPCCVPDP